MITSEINPPQIIKRECRGKEGESLDMIPVRMADEQVHARDGLSGLQEMQS